MDTDNFRFANRLGFIRGLLPLALLIAWSVASLMVASTASAAAPKIGEPAPAFEFLGEDGAVYSSASLYGEKGVVVAWFPKAFTPG